MDSDFIALYVNGTLAAGGPDDPNAQFTGDRWAGANGATLGDGDGDDSGNQGVGGRGGAAFGELNGYGPFQGFIALQRVLDDHILGPEAQEGFDGLIGIPDP